MPIEMSHPFRISASGGISVTPNPGTQISQRVKTLLSTQPGERRANYPFGVATDALLFENQGDLLGGVVEQQVRTALETYEPGVAIDSLSVSPGEDGSGGVDVALEYSRREDAFTAPGLARNTNTAVISVGGTVSEIVRG